MLPGAEERAGSVVLETVETYVAQEQAVIKGGPSALRAVH